MIRERPIYRGDKYKSLDSGNPLFLDLSSLPLSPPYTYPVSPQLKNFINDVKQGCVTERLLPREHKAQRMNPPYKP